ncbi:MAG: helix-turn-helix transcriptional regulator [Verrucomicrobiae bacterium]|nr:helix-turn-helix transcriptional regulator [Verrucomicrobiae bacterium]
MDSVSRQTEAFLRALAVVLKNARKRHGLSQIELAVRSGLSQSHISLVEKALRWPSSESVKRIAIALETSAADLIAAAERNAGS